MLTDRKPIQTEDEESSMDDIMEVAERIADGLEAMCHASSQVIKVQVPKQDTVAPVVNVSPVVNVPAHKPAAFEFEVTERDHAGRIRKFTATPL